MSLNGWFMSINSLSKNISIRKEIRNSLSLNISSGNSYEMMNIKEADIQ